MYRSIIKKVIRDTEIKPDDQILDLGRGTGRNANLMRKYLNHNGHITGLDISEHMEKQFRQKFNDDKRIEFINRRIDQPLNLQKRYDKAFISFVIHGFPHEVRDAVIKNAYEHLKPGGSFFILDYGESDMDKIPGLTSLVNLMHNNGAKVTAHLNHPGRMVNPKIPGNYFWSSTGEACENGGAVPEMITRDMMNKVTKPFMFLPALPAQRHHGFFNTCLSQKVKHGNWQVK